MKEKATRKSASFIYKFGILACLLNPSVFANCPTSASEWNHWILEKATHVADSQFFRFSPESPSTTQWDRKFQKSLVCLDQVPPFFENCTKNLQEGISAVEPLILNPSENKRMKLNITDRDYFELARPYTHRLPDELLDINGRISEDFISAIQEFAALEPPTQSGLYRLLEKINSNKSERARWQFVAFDRLPQAPNSPHQYSSLLFIPAESLKITPARDLYILIPIKKESTDPDRYNFSTLATVREGPHAGTYFLEDLEYDRSRTLSHIEPNPNNVANALSCYTCHQSGPIALHPRAVFSSYPESAEKTISTINRYISQKAFNNPYRTIPSIITPIGHEPLLKDLNFIKQACLKDRNALNSEALALQVRINCRLCHGEGRSRHPILPPPFTTSSVLSWHIKNGIMPPMKPYIALSPPSQEEINENTKLYECMKEVSRQTFLNKMTETPCEQPAPAPEKEKAVLPQAGQEKSFFQDPLIQLFFKTFR